MRENRILPRLERNKFVSEILIEQIFGDTLERINGLDEALNDILYPDLRQIVVGYDVAISIPKTSKAITKAIDDHECLDSKEQKRIEEILKQLYDYFSKYHSNLNLMVNDQSNFLLLSNAFKALLSGETQFNDSHGFTRFYTTFYTRLYILQALTKPTWVTRTKPDDPMTFTELLESSSHQPSDSEFINNIKNFIALPESYIDYYLARRLLDTYHYKFKLSSTEVSALCQILKITEENPEKQIAEILKTINIVRCLPQFQRIIKTSELPSDKLNNCIYLYEKTNGETKETRAYWIEDEAYVDYPISLNNVPEINKFFLTVKQDRSNYKISNNDKNFDKIKSLCLNEPVINGGCEFHLKIAHANRLANAYENRDFLPMIYRFIKDTENELKIGAQRIVLSDITKVKKQNSIAQAHSLIELFLQLSSNKPSERQSLITQIKTLCQSYLKNNMGEKNFDQVLDKLLSNLQILSNVNVEQRTSLMRIAEEMAEEMAKEIQNSLYTPSV